MVQQWLSSYWVATELVKLELPKKHRSPEVLGRSCRRGHAVIRALEIADATLQQPAKRFACTASQHAKASCLALNACVPHPRSAEVLIGREHLLNVFIGRAKSCQSHCEDSVLMMPDPTSS